MGIRGNNNTSNDADLSAFTGSTALSYDVCLEFRVQAQMKHLILISGFPGCGKTTFMQWLSRKKQYFTLDMERGGIDRDGFRDLWNRFLNGSDRESFIEQLFARSPRVALDWNFPVSCLHLVRALQERGCEVWWFEGYRLAARRHFIERGTEPVSNFDRHVSEICAEWQDIELIVGGRIIKSIDDEGHIIPPETIFHSFSGSPV